MMPQTSIVAIEHARRIAGVGPRSSAKLPMHNVNDHEQYLDRELAQIAFDQTRPLTPQASKTIATIRIRSLPIGVRRMVLPRT